MTEGRSHAKEKTRKLTLSTTVGRDTRWEFGQQDGSNDECHHVPEISPDC